MHKLIEVIGEGIGLYGRHAVKGMSSTSLAMIRSLYSWALCLTLLFGVMCFFIAVLTHHSEAWNLTMGLFFWNVVLFVGRHVFREALAGRFSSPRR